MFFIWKVILVFTSLLDNPVDYVSCRAGYPNNVAMLVVVPPDLLVRPQKDRKIGSVLLLDLRGLRVSSLLVLGTQSVGCGVVLQFIQTELLYVNCIYLVKGVTRRGRDALLEDQD